MTQVRYIRRILKEIQVQQDRTVKDLFLAYNQKDYSRWHATIIGPEGTPYQGGVFYLNIELPESYPMGVPRISFRTKIFHPNIDKNGKICLPQLNQSWSLVFTIQTLAERIINLLKIVIQYPRYVLQPQIGALYLKNKSQFKIVAQEWTQKYADFRLNQL